MIKKITVYNPIGEALSIELESPEKSGFSVLGISGLGPPKSEISTTAMVSYDGAVVNSSRVGMRNILLKLGFTEKPTIEELRRECYRYFPINQKVRFLIDTDITSMDIYGYVESNEIDIFSKEEFAAISLLCPAPYFNGLDYITTVFDGIYPMFSFPFSNESLTQPLLLFGSISDKTIRNIFYEGTVQTGFIMSLKATGAVVNPVIANANTGESMTIDTTKLTALIGIGFGNGDEIVISTIKGDKTITFIHNGISTNILNVLDKNTDWLSLIKGSNILSYTATSGLASLSLTTTHRVLYEGI